jgi:hypothetical protein
MSRSKLTFQEQFNRRHRIRCEKGKYYPQKKILGLFWIYLLDHREVIFYLSLEGAREYLIAKYRLEESEAISEKVHIYEVFPSGKLLLPPSNTK